MIFMKRFSGRFLLFVMLWATLLLHSSQARGDYDASSGMYNYSYYSSDSWLEARYKINYNSTFMRYDPLDWVAYLNVSCPFGISGIMGTNCFGFVSFVLDKEGRGNIVSYTTDARRYAQQTGGTLIDGCQWLNENHNGGP